MRAGELLQTFSSEMGGLGPQILRDDEQLRYLDNAYHRFVRQIGGIADFTSEACEVEITAGEPLVELHPTILSIERVTKRSDSQVIEIINQTDLGRLSGTDYGRVTNLRLDHRRGPVRYLMIGAQITVGRWIQVPEVADMADLMIHRLPLKHITALQHQPEEIDEQHHLALLDWMKALAYKRPGTAYFNPSLSAAFAASFDAYCEQVKRELARYKHKTRVVAYGGL